VIFISVTGSPQNTIDASEQFGVGVLMFIQSDDRAVTYAYTDDGFLDQCEDWYCYDVYSTTPLPRGSLLVIRRAEIGQRVGVCEDVAVA
jgi:hypothetical protein